MNPSSRASWDYKYDGGKYKYLIASNNKNNEILIRIRKCLFRYCQMDKTFSLKINNIILQNVYPFPSGIKANVALNYLVSNNYIPKIERNVVFFRKIPFLHSIRSNLLIRYSRDVFDAAHLLFSDLTPQTKVIERAFKALHPVNLPSQSVSKSENQSISRSGTPPQPAPQPVIKPPQTVIPPVVTTSPTSPKKLPIKELKDIFQYSQGINLEKLIQELRMNVENNEGSSIGNFLINQMDKPSPELQAFIQANASSGMLVSFVMSQILSKDFIYFCFANKTDNASLKASGSIGKLFASCIELKKFIDEFYLSDSNTYDYANLVLTLLLDEDLSAFLQNDQIQKQLINIISAFKIPAINEETSKKLIELLINLQKTAQEQAINSLSGLSSSIQNGDFPSKVLDLIPKIIPLFQVLLVSNPYPVEHLLKTLRDAKTEQINANQKRDYFDCKQAFESFQDSSLGVFGPLIISTSLQNKIKSRDLSHFTFSEFPKEKSVNLSFNHFHFEGFSFNESEFHHMTFKDCCFIQCNFSNVKFFGKITFINVYMDQQCADSMMQAITESFQANEDLTVAGLSEVWILTKGLINEKLTINQALKEFLAKSRAKESSEKQEEQPAEQGWLDWLTPSWFKPTPQSAETPEKPIPETVKEKTADDKKQIEDWEVKFQALEKNLEHKIREYNDQLVLASPEEVRRLNEHLEIHQRAIKEVQSQLEEIQAQKIAKEQIALEQNQLLKHELPQIKAYYETILTRIYFFFHSVALVSNEELNLLETNSGKTTKIANNNDKFLKKQTLRDRMSKSLDHFVEKVDFVKPVFKLPILADLVAPVLTKIVDTNDKSLVQKASGFINGLTSRKMEKMADEIARKLTFSYEEQIGLLTVDSAKKFAKIATECIAASLLNGDFKDNGDFVTQAWLSVRLLGSNKKAKVPVLQLPIPLTKKTYPGMNGKHYTIQNLYHDSGIAIRDEAGWIKCPLKGKEKQEFGYFRIEKEELKYFPSNPLKDQEPSKETYKLGERNSMQKSHELGLSIQENKKELRKLQILVNQLHRKVLSDETELAKMQKGEAVTPQAPPLVRTSAPINHQSQNKVGANWPIRLPNNTGANCYINASLQFLFRIPEICNLITKGYDLDSLEKDKVRDTLRTALYQLYVNKDVKQLNVLLKTAQSQEKFLKDGIDERQHDAQEFISYILYQFPTFAPIKTYKWIEEDSKIWKSSEVSINHLQLDLPESNSDLVSCLDTLFKKEKVSTKIKKEDDDTFQNHTLKLKEPSDHIIIQLKRYRFDHEKSKSIKNSAVIGFPKDYIVHLPFEFENQSKKIRYEIVSIINHEGTSANKGHYVTYLKEEGKQEWTYLSDDKKMNNIIPKDIETEACMLLLQRC